MRSTGGQPPRPTPVEPTTLSAAARTIAASIRSDRAVCDHVVELLVATGRLPEAVHERQQPQSQMLVATTIARLAKVVEGLLDAALTEVIETHDEHLAEIRRFFLQPCETYSITDLATLWRISPDDARDILHDELAHREGSEAREAVTSEGLRIPWARAVGTTVRFSLLRPFEIERALGNEFSSVRTERWRTVPVLIRIPLFLANAFELDASIPPRLALAHRIEQILFEFFTTEDLTGSAANGVPRP